MHCKWNFIFLLVFLITGCIPVSAQALEVRISAGKVQYGDYSATGLTAQLLDGQAVLRVQSAVSSAVTALVINNFTVECDSLDLAAGDFCASGPWSFLLADAVGQWQLPVAGTVNGFKRTGDGWTIGSAVMSGNLLAQVEASAAAERVEVSVNWAGQLIRELPAIAPIPEQIQWVRTGTSSGNLALDWPTSGTASYRFKVDVKGLGFDSPEGRFAGEKLTLQAKGKAQIDEAMTIQISGDIQSGDLLIDNFYASFSDQAVQWDARLSKRDHLLSISEAHLADGRSLDIKAEAHLDLDDPMASLRYRVSYLEMHFPEAYERYIESMASARTLDGLTMTGSLLWSGNSQSNAFSSGVLDISDLTIVDRKRGRFALTGLAAHIVPGDREIGSRFSWRGLLFQRINLGAGEAMVESIPGQFALTQPLRLNVLGGILALEDLRVKLPGNDAAADAEPEIRLYATLENMDIEQLTKALAWPSFGGSISGKIPGVTLKDGVLAVEGQIEFNVFDGQMLLSGLRIERPFGVLPSLAADLEAVNLDLQQLTHTFSFGSISGRMTGFVHSLRMLDWKPVAFDAWLGTPVQETGSHKISRQAVNRLTTIGGGSATAALSGPVLKLFSNFSYKRLGLGCRLRNYICEVRGLDDDAASVLIMEGAGVPKIMIRAYNREMDWPTLLGGLAAASQGESIRIGDK